MLRDRDPDTRDEATTFLVGVMNDLEVAGTELKIPADEDGKVIVRNFALQIFKRADDQDRAGRANK